MALTNKESTINKGNIASSLISALKDRDIDDLTASRLAVNIIGNLPIDYLDNGNLLKSFFYNLSITAKKIADELPEGY